MEKALFTEKQIQRRERNKVIVEKFKKLKKRYPDSSKEQIFLEIAKEYQVTSQAIRSICKLNGVC